MMKEDILSGLDNPKQLEKLYRENTAEFKTAFNTIFPQIKDHKVAEFWNERLNFEERGIERGTTDDFLYVIFLSLIAGVIAKIPITYGVSEDFYYPRNISFILFPVLTLYFIRKNKLWFKQIIPAFVITLASVLFINFLPDINKSDTTLLSCIHLPLLLWMFLGYYYTGCKHDDIQKRISFLRYNGDIIIMTAIILIAGGILTGITIGLFHLIGFNIEQFYFKYIVVFGLSAAPVIATHITQTNPHLVNKVSPVIAKIFSPLVLITLVIYLVAILYSGKNPYNDREFLMTFNALLIGVMAIILFSVAETGPTRKKAEPLILMLLSFITILVNLVALSAILFRINEWGITPNRIAVLVGNILMLINLIIVGSKLFSYLKNSTPIATVAISIAVFIPVYGLWTFIVTFIFPLIFGFK